MHPRDAEKGDFKALNDGDERQIQEQGKSSSQQQKTPLALWPIFVFAIIAGGTSAPVTYLMQRAAPISVTGWRHQVTAIVMLPSFIYEIFHLDPRERKRALTGRNLGLHFLSSLAIGTHLVAYTWAVYNTSIPHSVFLSATSPVYVALYVKCTGGKLLPMELGGVFITFVGIGVFALDRNSEHDDRSTFVGDFVAVLAAVLMAIYLTIGKSLRSWMPLFVFQYPIVVVDMLLVSLAGIAFEGWNDSDTGVITGPFGWLHKVISASLKRPSMHILQVATALLAPLLIQFVIFTKDVILVGHSFGGVSISLESEYFPAKVEKGVYLSALMPKNGESLSKFLTPDLIAQQVAEGAITYVFGNASNPSQLTSYGIGPNKTALIEAYYTIAPPQDVALVLSVGKPQPYAPTIENVTLTEANYGSVPRYYIRTELDRAVTPALQTAIIANNPPKEVFSLADADHGSFFSTPKELAGLLEYIAAL